MIVVIVFFDDDGRCPWSAQSYACRLIPTSSTRCLTTARTQSLGPCLPFLLLSWDWTTYYAAAIATTRPHIAAIVLPQTGHSTPRSLMHRQTRSHCRSSSPHPQHQRMPTQRQRRWARTTTIDNQSRYCSNLMTAIPSGTLSLETHLFPKAWRSIWMTHCPACHIQCQCPTTYQTWSTTWNNNLTIRWPIVVTVFWDPKVGVHRSFFFSITSHKKTELQSSTSLASFPAQKSTSLQLPPPSKSPNLQCTDVSQFSVRYDYVLFGVPG